MKDREIKIGQYAYSKNGDVIRIEKICEDEKKYMGCAINQIGDPWIILVESDIYGIAGKTYIRKQ